MRVKTLQGLRFCIDGPYILLLAIGAVSITAASLTCAAKHPFPEAVGTCG
jgi:hypothetical protein